MIIEEKNGMHYAKPTLDWLTNWQGVFSKDICAPTRDALSTFKDCTNEEKERWEEENLPPKPTEPKNE